MTGFFSAPELQTDGVDEAWSGVVDVDNACVNFLSKKFLSAFFQRAEVSFECPGLFNILRCCEERRERSLLVGVVCVLLVPCFSLRLIDEKRLCNQSESSYVCG